MRFKRVITILTSSALALTIIGCAANEDPVEVDEEIEQEVEVGEPEIVEEDSADTVEESTQDEELTNKILEEEGVLGGQVYQQDENLMVGTLMLDDELDEETAVALAERYAEEIKEKYPEMAVNVQAVKGGENVASIDLE